MPTIEPTDEMVEAFDAAIGQFRPFDVPGGLKAVFAIVERDYRLTKLCPEELVPGLRCTRTVFDEPHRGDHEGKTSTGNAVKWS